MRAGAVGRNCAATKSFACEVTVLRTDYLETDRVSATLERMVGGVVRPSGVTAGEQVRAGLLSALAYARYCASNPLTAPLVEKGAGEAIAARRQLRGLAEADITAVQLAVVALREAIAGSGELIPTEHRDGFLASLARAAGNDAHVELSRVVGELTPRYSAVLDSGPTAALVREAMGRINGIAAPNTSNALTAAALPWEGVLALRSLALGSTIDAPEDEGAARARQDLIAMTARSLNSGWLWFAGPTEFRHALTLAHFWLIGELGIRSEMGLVLRRYAERAALFEREDYVSFADNNRPDPDRHSNPDEKEFKRRVCLYLHDRGFTPLPEVELGSGRADLLATHPTAAARLAIEAKVIRVGDSTAKVRARLLDGVGKAVRYARGGSADVGYLLAFWLHPGEPRLWTSRQFGDVDVRIVVVDLRDAPTRRARRDVVSIPADQPSAEEVEQAVAAPATEDGTGV